MIYQRLLKVPEAEVARNRGKVSKNNPHHLPQNKRMKGTKKPKIIIIIRIIQTRVEAAAPTEDNKVEDLADNLTEDHNLEAKAYRTN